MNRRPLASGLRPLALVAAAASALAGCPSPNIYGTARTIPVGTIQHTASIDTIGISGSGGTFFTPTLPTYQLRLGVHDRVDLGFRLGNLTSLGFDAKVNLVRGPFDLALAPGVQGIYISASSGSSSSGAGIMYLNLPVILGFNLSQNFSLIATPGIAYALGFSYDSVSSGDSARYTADGFAARLGVGANIRASRFFSLQPEITALYFPDSGGVLFTGGLGFSFGSHPTYDDI